MSQNDSRIAIRPPEKRTINLSIVDKMAGHKCVLYFRGSTVHKEEDNLSIVDKMAGHKCVLYSEVPLYIRKRTTSISIIVDKMAGPNVSFIQRLHCT